MSIEQKVNYQLNKFPAVKKVVKRAYQRTMYAISPKIVSEGDITRISPDDARHEYFFGYYDKSPWDATDRYMLCMRAADTWSDVSPKEKADILLIDTALPETDAGRVRKIAETSSWNVQQSCMLQWLGPDFSSRILYNDCRDGKYVSVILTLATGEERVIGAPVYSVSADGTMALTLDFSRLYNLRPGYGYYNVPESTAGEALPDAAAIWKIDLANGGVEPLLTYRDFASFEPRKEMLEAGAVHKVNHIMLSPDGKRFMVLYRWFNGQRKYTRLVTCGTDGRDMYVLSDDDMVSHCFWKDNETILAFENKKDGGPGYYLMHDRTQEYSHCWPQLSGDGHPSYSPDGKLIVTDTYPDRARIAEIRLMDGTDETKTRVKVIARVFAPFKYDNDTRCDLHPRWNHAGDTICFDSVFEGHRGLYTVKADFAQENARSAGGSGSTAEAGSSAADKRKIRVAFVFTACKQSGPIQQMLNLATNLDRDVFDLTLITLYDEPDDGSSQLSKYKEAGIPHVRCALSKVDIMLGRTKKLDALLKELQIDVIHSLGVFPDYAVARLKTGRQIITLRNFVWDDYPAKFGTVEGGVLARLHLYAMKHTAVTVTCSRSLHDIYKKKLGLDYGYICNGVNVERYTRPDRSEVPALREELGLPADACVLVYSGQLIDRKNQKFLLECFTEHFGHDGSYYLLILGDGPDLADLQQMAEGYGNIDLHGNVTDVERYLAASDIYVSTSKSEGMPNGVLEAMACGLPVVLSDIAQHRELFDESRKIGYLYHQGNAEELAGRIKKLAGRSDLAACGDKAHELACTVFSAANMSRKYQEKYKEIAKREN